MECNAFLWLQFFPTVIISVITAVLFKETFQEASREYLRSLDIGTLRLLVIRPLLLFVLIAIAYLPLSAVTADRINEVIRAAAHSQTNYQTAPVSWSFVYLQCISAIAFSEFATLLAERATKSKSLSLVILFPYFAIEGGGLCNLIGKYSLFHNAVSAISDFQPWSANVYLYCAVSMICYSFVFVKSA